jgi:hypothetical protein
MRPTLVLLFVVLFLGTSSLLFVGDAIAEQSASKRLTVVVQDPIGAVIPGAAVHVQHWKTPDYNVHVPTIPPTEEPPGPGLVRDADGFADNSGQVTLEIRGWNGEVEVFASARAFLPSVNTVPLNPKGDTRLVMKLAVGREPVL